MGYSAYVVVKSHKQLTRAYEFLKGITPFDKLVGREASVSHFTSYPVCGDDLDYRGVDGPLTVGFNFSTSGEAAPYLYSLLRFIALRVGSQRTIEGVLTKYIVYDGCECWPVGNCAPNGISADYPKKFDDPNDFKEILAEMNRLDKLWPLEDG
jgi:hypothetical protein